MTVEEPNKNNLENNEVPKDTQEKIEQKEISPEEFLNWLDNEGNSFKNETTEEMSKSNSVDLDQQTFEKIKNETGVEQELDSINQEAEKCIDEIKLSLKENVEMLANTPTSLEEVFNSDSERIAELRARVSRTPEQENELLTDRINKLIQLHKHMIENRQNFSGKEIDEVQETLDDFQMQHRDTLGQMVIEPLQEQLHTSQKRLDSYNAQNKKAFENPDKEAFMNTSDLEQEITKLTTEISEVKNKTEYKYIPKDNNQNTGSVNEQTLPIKNETLDNVDPFAQAREEFQGKEKPIEVAGADYDERRKKYYENIGIPLLNKNELFVDRIKNSVDLRDLVSRLIDLGDITAPDGYVYKKDDMITCITNLTGVEDPNLQKITNTHGLRDKVKELLQKRGKEDNL